MAGGPAAGKIDVHFHLIPQFYREAVYEAGSGPAIGRYPDWTPDLALDLMDKHGIALAITSIAQPGVGFLPADKAADFARKCNDYTAELIGHYPRRFGCFGLLPMHDIDAAIAEARYCLDTLRFEGISLFASYGETFLGDASFDPLMDYLDAKEGGRPHSSEPASVEQIAHAAVARVHDRIRVRHHAGGGQSAVLRRARTLSLNSSSSFPMPAARCRSLPGGFRFRR